MGVTKFNFESYLLKERPLRVPENAFSTSGYHNEKNTTDDYVTATLFILLTLFVIL